MAEPLPGGVDLDADPASVVRAPFPEGADLDERLVACVAWATLAPSGHNTQPWRFRVAEGAVEVYADRSRALPVVDPDDRELTISCGAALGVLVLAMEAHGLGPAVEMLPDPEDPDLLARVVAGSPGGNGAKASGIEALLAAVPERHTTRLAFDDTDVGDSLLVSLVDAAESQGSGLRILVGDERDDVVGLVSEGDRVQFSDRRFRRELAAWMHPNRTHSRDGMPGYAFGLAGLQATVGPVMIRTFDMGRGQAARDRELLAHSPVLAVLWTTGDEPAEWLAAGRALAHVSLVATAAGLRMSYLNQPCEVADLRRRLRHRASLSGWPQLVVRLGFGPQARPTPRRTLREVLVAVPELPRLERDDER